MRYILFGGFYLGKMWENMKKKIGRFSGRLWPGWGNTGRVATAGLGSIGLISSYGFLVLID